jgi:calcineurin-like phosphoesterase family protein
MTIWVTSDTHFNHENILSFDNGRPEFDSVEAMNEFIIDQWNSVVRPGDKVYHLGDVFFGSKDWFRSNWPRLKGSKRLIVGNHDDIKFLSSGAFFKKVLLWRALKDFGIVLTHTPLHPSSLMRWKNVKNVHGHTHRNSLQDDRYINVSVEQTGYRPVNLEELR